jgi:hypothetical protein
MHQHERAASSFLDSRSGCQISRAGDTGRGPNFEILLRQRRRPLRRRTIRRKSGAPSFAVFFRTCGGGTNQTKTGTDEDILVILVLRLIARRTYPGNPLSEQAMQVTCVGNWNARSGNSSPFTSSTCPLSVGLFAKCSQTGESPGTCRLIP